MLYRAMRAVEELKGRYKRGDAGSVRRLMGVARNCLQFLDVKAAAGDGIALSAFVGLLIEGVQALYGLQHRQPELSRELAGRRQCWPGFLTVDRDWRRWNEKMVGLLGVGEKVPLNFAGKSWTRRTPEVRVALELLESLRVLAGAPRGSGWGGGAEAAAKALKLRKGLAPLCRANYALWWKAAEPLFVREYGPTFEDRKEFAHYWRSAAYRGQKNARALIRRDIKAKIKQAFRSVARRAAAV
jgi:hypothetical protein